MSRILLLMLSCVALSPLLTPRLNAQESAAIATATATAALKKKISS